MILRFGLGVTLAVIVCILVMVLFGWLWKKMNKKIAAGATIGFFIGIIASMALIVIPSRAYVITGAKEYKHYLVYGSSMYTMSTGQEIELNTSGMKCMLINDSQQPVIVEEVVYGFGSGGGTLWVEPLTATIVDDVTIDYFFDDEPPSSIEQSSPGAEIRLWVREAGIYDRIMDDDFQDNLNSLEELLEGDAEEGSEESACEE